MQTKNSETSHTDKRHAPHMSQPASRLKLEEIDLHIANQEKNRLLLEIARCFIDPLRHAVHQLSIITTYTYPPYIALITYSYPLKVRIKINTR